jgi:hypothetical protein
MNHRSEPAYEISPDHRIEPPFFSQPGSHISDAVRTANHQAADRINEAKDEFIAACFHTILPENDPSPSIDLSKLQLTLRNNYSPTIVLPSGHDPNSPKQKGHLRQTGHTLTLNYDGKWIGTLEIEYKHDGTITINASIKP